MSTTTRHGQDLLTFEQDRMRMLTAACAALVGVLGYGIALGLARATAYAEQVEEDEYCHPSAVPPAA